MEPEEALKLIKQYKDQLELEEIKGPFLEKLLV